MGIFQILLVVVNLSVPAYFIFRKPHPKTETTVDWAAWEKNMTRLIDSDGGFPGCSTLDLVSTLEDMCIDSRDAMKPGETTVIEKASNEVAFTCEVTKSSVIVGWRLQNSKDDTLKCRDPGGGMVTRSPGFTFAHSGRMRSMEFSVERGVRQSIPVRNCRSKAVKAKHYTPPPTIDDFMNQLGSMSGDPPDVLGGNFMCFVFDLSPLWVPWRERFPR